MSPLQFVSDNPQLSAFIIVLTSAAGLIALRSWINSPRDYEDLFRLITAVTVNGDKKECIRFGYPLAFPNDKRDMKKFLRDIERAGFRLALRNKVETAKLRAPELEEFPIVSMESDGRVISDAPNGIEPPLCIRVFAVVKS